MLTKPIASGAAQRFGELEVVVGELRTSVPHVARQAREHGLGVQACVVAASQRFHCVPVAQVVKSSLSG